MNFSSDFNYFVQFFILHYSSERMMERVLELVTSFMFKRIKNNKDIQRTIQKSLE